MFTPVTVLEDDLIIIPLSEPEGLIVNLEVLSGLVVPIPTSPLTLRLESVPTLVKLLDTTVLPKAVEVRTLLVSFKFKAVEERTDDPFILKTFPEAIFQSILLVHLSWDWSYIIVLSLPALRVIPPPFALAGVVLPLAKVILMSSTSNVAVFIVVLVPLTVRLPVTVRLPPIVASLVTLKPVPSLLVRLRVSLIDPVPATWIPSTVTVNFVARSLALLPLLPPGAVWKIIFPPVPVPVPWPDCKVKCWPAVLVPLLGLTDIIRLSPITKLPPIRPVLKDADIINK